MSLGEIFIFGSARLVVAIVLLTTYWTWSTQPNNRAARGGQLMWRAAWSGRLMWTLGCMILWLHTGFAFGYAHDWSHEAAWTATAEQTARVTGWYWGGGLYVNYGTLLLWTADVVGWWRTDAPKLYEATFRHRCFRLYLLFMTFQASVVFATPTARWIAMTLWLAVAMGIIWRRIFDRGGCS